MARLDLISNIPSIGQKFWIVTHEKVRYNIFRNTKAQRWNILNLHCYDNEGEAQYWFFKKNPDKAYQAPKCNRKGCPFCQPMTQRKNEHRYICFRWDNPVWCWALKKFFVKEIIKDLFR